MLFMVQACLAGRDFGFSALRSSNTFLTGWATQVCHPPCIQQLLCRSQKLQETQNWDGCPLLMKRKKQSSKEECHSFLSLKCFLNWSSYLGKWHLPRRLSPKLGTVCDERVQLCYFIVSAYSMYTPVYSSCST